MKAVTSVTAFLLVFYADNMFYNVDMINPKYVVKKVLNNNVVSASHGFNEVVVTGLGIGFNAKPKDVIDESKIEKIFELRREDYYKMVELATEIDEDIFNASYNLIQQIDTKHKFELDAHAYMVMIDHINFAIERHKTNQNIHNFLVTEMKILYPRTKINLERIAAGDARK